MLQAVILFFPPFQHCVQRLGMLDLLHSSRERVMSQQTMVLALVAQNTVRTYGVNHVFRFVEGFCLHRKSRQLRKLPIFHHTCATCSELTSYIGSMGSCSSGINK